MPAWTDGGTEGYATAQHPLRRRSLGVRARLQAPRGPSPSRGARAPPQGGPRARTGGAAPPRRQQQQLARPAALDFL